MASQESGQAASTTDANGSLVKSEAQVAKSSDQVLQDIKNILSDSALQIEQIIFEHITSETKKRFSALKTKIVDKMIQTLKREPDIRLSMNTYDSSCGAGAFSQYVTTHVENQFFWEACGEVKSLMEKRRLTYDEEDLMTSLIQTFEQNKRGEIPLEDEQDTPNTGN